MSKVTVIGIGNTLRQDDGLGVYLIDRLAEENLPQGVRLIRGETDINASLEEACHAEKLIIIDAVQKGEPPGTIHVLPLEEVWQEVYAFLSAHELNLLSLLLLYSRKPKEGFLMGIEPASLDFGTTLSGQVQSAVEELKDLIKLKIMDLV